MKKFVVFAAAAVAAMSFDVDTVKAEGFEIPGEFSANVAFTNDYRFRGISQSSEEPAIQGGLDYSLPLGESGLGLYLGAWASSVDFADNNEASVEIDYYGGLTYEISGVGIDLGVIQYTYPGAADSLNYDYTELKLGLSYGITDALSVGLGYNYSPEYFGDSGEFHYPNASVEFAPELGLPLPLTFGATYGYNIIEKEATFGVSDDYSDWSVSVGTNYKNIDLSVAYIDTDERGDAADATAMVLIGASF